MLKEIGLDQENAHVWMPPAIHSRGFQNVHSFESFGLKGFRIAYHVPVAPNRPGKFNLSLLSLKIVIEYSLKNNSKTKTKPYG